MNGYQVLKVTSPGVNSGVNLLELFFLLLFVNDQKPQPTNQRYPSDLFSWIGGGPSGLSFSVVVFWGWQNRHLALLWKDKVGPLGRKNSSNTENSNPGKSYGSCFSCPAPEKTERDPSYHNRSWQSNMMLMGPINDPLKCEVPRSSNLPPQSRATGRHCFIASEYLPYDLPDR